MSSPTATISNIQRFSTEDGPGIRTTVFFKGCPLRCPWCHNPEGLVVKPQLAYHPNRCIGCGECAKVCSIGAPKPGDNPRCVVCGKCAEACPCGAREIIGREVDVDALFEEIARDMVFYGDEGGVTASGGEAALHDRFVAEFFGKCREKGVHTALDTSGAVARTKLDPILDRSDMVLFDLKIMDEERHKEVIGYPLTPILENLEYITGLGKPVWIRFPIVTGYTDNDENVDAVIDLLKNLSNIERVDLLPFHQLGRHKYREMGLPYSLVELKSPTDESVEEIKKRFEEAGLTVA